MKRMLLAPTLLAFALLAGLVVGAAPAAASVASAACVLAAVGSARQRPARPRFVLCIRLLLQCGCLRTKVLGVAIGREAAHYLMTFGESEDGRVGLGEPGAWREFEPAFAAAKSSSDAPRATRTPIWAKPLGTSPL